MDRLRLRVRINGRASIIDDPAAFAQHWPLAQRYVQVDVEQVYGSCQSRITQMKLMAPSDSIFQDD